MTILAKESFDDNEEIPSSVDKIQRTNPDIERTKKKKFTKANTVSLEN